MMHDIAVWNKFRIYENSLHGGWHVVTHHYLCKAVYEWQNIGLQKWGRVTGTVVDIGS